MSIKSDVQKAGQAALDTAKDVGHKIGEGAEKAVDWVKEKAQNMGGAAKDSACCASSIREHMEVVASCGTKVGTVDHLEGSAIKLTKSDSPDGQHHFIPQQWVESVDDKVHLRKNSEETRRTWCNDAAACTAC